MAIAIFWQECGKLWSKTMYISCIGLATIYYQYFDIQYGWLLCMRYIQIFSIVKVLSNGIIGFATLCCLVKRCSKSFFHGKAASFRCKIVHWKSLWLCTEATHRSKISHVIVVITAVFHSDLDIYGVSQKTVGNFHEIVVEMVVVKSSTKVFLAEKVTTKDPMDSTINVTMIKTATILATISLVSIW